METILQKYEFRTIRLEETEQAAEIERICFPPNEACSYEHMAARIKKAPDLFLVAVDRETGKLADISISFFISISGGRMSDKCPPFVRGGKSALFSSLAARFRSASVED